MTAVAIVSGGMDSVTLAYRLVQEGHALYLLSVDYGQRHRKELTFAALCAERLDATYQCVDFRSMLPLLAGSALTSPTVPVPEGHYAAPTMAATVVPNRNAILLSLAFAYAVSLGADLVATAVHAGDHPIYPDCRPEFIHAFDAMEALATSGYAHPRLHLYAPYVHWSKADIATQGESLRVPWHETWSCYAGGPLHCGRCSTCVERQEALYLAGAHDRTAYADPAYWRSVVTLPGGPC